MSGLRSHPIVPLTILREDGSFATMEEAQRVQHALRDPADGPVCHVGQAVRVGPRNVLRLAASAPDVCKVARGLAAGLTLEEAFRPVAADLDQLFAKWATISDRSRGP